MIGGQMLKIFIILIFTASFSIPCGSLQSPTNYQTINLLQQERPTNKPEKKSCDYSSFKALKMNSLPAEKLVKPAYPPEAKEQKITGTVLVKVIVDKKGKVIKACA